MRHFRMLFFLLIVPAALLAAALRCAVCGSEIRGRYVSDGRGKNYCSEACWERTLPKCAVCGTAIRGQHYRRDGRYYCSQPCFAQTLPKCAVCGTAIRGEHYRKDGRYYCSQSCFAQTFPKCDYCGKPLAGKYRVSGIPGEPQVKLCMDCVGRPLCFACMRPGTGAMLPDGRALCPECAAQRLTPAEEESLFAEIRTRLERLLGATIPCRVKFYTLDEVRFKRRVPKSLSSGVIRELGFCQSRMEISGKPGHRRTSGYDCTVYLLSDLPRRIFIDTVAHELAHHWQYHRYPFLRKDPLDLAEGFAEYAASRMNLVYRQPEMNRRKEQNPDPVYGGGYRKFRTMAEKGGPRAVFEHLKRNSEP